VLLILIYTNKQLILILVYVNCSGFVNNLYTFVTNDTSSILPVSQMTEVTLTAFTALLLYYYH